MITLRLRRGSALLVLVLYVGRLAAQTSSPWSALERPRVHEARPTTPPISAADLMTRLFIFADDSMGGRLLDSRGNVLGVEYIAREAARIGLTGAGDAGSFFQSIPVYYRVLDTTMTIAVKGTRLVPWEDFILRDQGAGARSLEGTATVYGGTLGEPASLIAPEAAAGKLVVFSIVPAGFYPGLPGAVERTVLSARYPDAAGLAVASMEFLSPRYVATAHDTGQEFRSSPPGPVPSFLYITRRAAQLLMGADLDSLKAGAGGPVVTGNVRIRDGAITYPARNVVGLLPGSDPVLRNQYVVLGAHNDHVGTAGVSLPHDSVYVVNHLYRPGGADDSRPRLTAAQADTVNGILGQIRKATAGRSARPDSIYNGADDDGSGSMALLEIAEYFAAAPVKPKRSLLFIWHVGEEEGLYGSEYFTDHPTVARDSIVAELNMDMVGRGSASDATGTTSAGARIHGGPDYLQLVGSRRLSTELGNLAETVNASERTPLHFDYSLDANGHPQNIYCRSDHYEYARYGIPIVFFTTGGHADYHQLTDEPQYIDYDRLARVSRFVADLAAAVAGLNHRVVVDQPKPDPRGECRQ